MKTFTSDEWRMTSDDKKTIAREWPSCHPSPVTRHAFTLIELLVVISIIALLAAFTVPVLKSMKRREFINKTQAEMAQIETAIDSYKATYGFYPPGNPNSPFFSPLYFELLGTTNSNGTYYTLDGGASIRAVPPPVPTDIQKAFGVSGFINCTKPGAGEDAPAAKTFLPDLKPGQIGLNITNNNVPATLLLASVGGPDPRYPFASYSSPNPWRYAYPGTNNPNSYDLWVQLKIAGTTNLICNWSKQVQLNTTLP